MEGTGLLAEVCFRMPPFLTAIMELNRRGTPTTILFNSFPRLDLGPPLTPINHHTAWHRLQPPVYHLLRALRKCQKHKPK